MQTTDAPMSPDDVARAGAEVYQQRIRPSLQPVDEGKFVAIDVLTGDFELDVDDYQAVARLRSRRPTANVWLERAGHPTAYVMRRGR
jgi:hypothetical protein